jgi:hypothetical protein
VETAKSAPNWKTYALLALTLGVIATATAVLVLTDRSAPVGGGTSTSSTATSSVTTTTDQTPGIELLLSVTPNQGPLGTTFDVNVTALNTLLRANNVTGIGDYHGVQVNPLCNTGPVTFEVLQGYYTAANFTGGSVLNIHGVQNMMCIVPTSALSYYLFQPNSSIFEGPLPNDSGQGAAAMTSRAATTSASLQNVYSSEFQNPERFPAGTYTIVAADNWGQLAVAHFVVLP